MSSFTLSLVASLLVLTCHVVKMGSAANILFFHSFVTPSHRIAIWPLAERLADKGHNVTYIFPLRSKRLGDHPKIVEIIPSKMLPILKEVILNVDINIRLENRQLQWMAQIPRTSLKLCEAFYQSPEVMEWMATPHLHFDLIMMDGAMGECGYGLVHKFGAKLILFTPLIQPYMYDGVGIVQESWSYPEVLFHAKPDQMSLVSRTLSTLSSLLVRLQYLEFLKTLEPIIREGLNVTQMPPLTELEATTSLVFVNTHIIEDYPRSLPPMFVSYSGLWCSKEKRDKRTPLPNKISKFIDKWPQGFIYISFGSAISASTMPPGMRASFFNAFRNFPKLGFLLRWTGRVPEERPGNVLLSEWFPQRDILAHPKIKGAVMQGAGGPSTQEALCFGVPLIVVPIVADQDYYANRLEHVGAAIQLQLNNITEETLSSSLRELLNTSKYKTRMTELSELFRDRPLDPLDNVLYWTEYVLRRDTSLLRPLGMRQAWWERRLLDVYSLLLAITLAIIGIFLFGFRLIYFRIVAHYNLRWSGGGKEKVE